MVATAKNPTLHGNAPDASSHVLLLIDVINDLDFEGNETFINAALETSTRIERLVASARRACVPVIYVNDNFGRWRSDQRALLQHCMSDGVPGAPMVRRLEPKEADYFVLKPKHSGFYATALDTLLQYLQARHLVIAGFTTDQCVLFTASDAFLRDYTIQVPHDCTATVVPADHEPALELMRKRLSVDTRSGHDVDFGSREAADVP
jgi:nicotinamidase-related amidase